MKSEHKPIQHLNDWKRKIVGLLTDSDPSREDPQIFWRRDAILSIAEEKDVRHSGYFLVGEGRGEGVLRIVVFSTNTPVLDLGWYL